MLFIRCLRLDRLSFSIKHFISKNLGPQFSDTPDIHLKNIQIDLNNSHLLIFILARGIDPTNMLINIAVNCNKKEKLQFLSLGNGQESNATK